MAAAPASARANADVLPLMLSATYQLWYDAAHLLERHNVLRFVERFNRTQRFLEHRQTRRTGRGGTNRLRKDFSSDWRRILEVGASEPTARVHDHIEERLVIRPPLNQF